jgi:hypothetical protein
VTGGGIGNVVEKNLVVNHDTYGIVTTMLPDKSIYMATDNVVRNNTVTGTGLTGFLLVGPLTARDCYEHNKYSSWSVPVWTTMYHTCRGLNLPFSFDMAGAFLLLRGQADAARNVPAVLTIGSGLLPHHRTICLKHEPHRVIPPTRSS